MSEGRPGSGESPAAPRAHYTLVHSDAFAWLSRAAPRSIQAVVTDPPYGLVEYTPEQLRKRARGRGGVWRVPPSLDGSRRSPLPRFTVLRARERDGLRAFFARLAAALEPVLVPGAHVFVATNPLVSHLVCDAFERAGYEKRGEIIRVVQTLRGGDRPKNAHDAFPDVSVMPRSCTEPWLLFRVPCEGRVQDNLRRFGTGGLRRVSAGEPFRDLITAPPAGARERALAPHPTLKPQRLMRQLARAALPLGRGVILDPFMGSGATLAAAAACGLESVGVEIRAEYYRLARRAVPRLAALAIDAPDSRAR